MVDMTFDTDCSIKLAVYQISVAFLEKFENNVS